jgi:hypothetical protein
MNLQGNITDFPMYEVAQIIAMGRRTGKLHLNGEIERLDIYFVDGEAVFACPLINKDKLGDILLSKGFISEENFANALRLQRIYTERGTNKRLGTILVELRVISRTALVKHLKCQIEDAIYAILSEDKGTFYFDGEIDLDEEDILVPMNIERIIQDGIRIVEERKRIKKSIPSLSSIYERNKSVENGNDPGLNYLDWKVVSLVDGIRTIEDIINTAGYPPIEVLKILSALSEKGVIVCRE